MSVDARHPDRAGPLPIALTMGEPAGIGGEIALMAWAAAREVGGAEGTAADPGFFLIDDPERLAKLAQRLACDIPIRPIREPEDAVAVFPRALPVLPLRLPTEVEPGKPSPATAPSVLESVERAVALTRAGKTAAIVTNPIHKKSLYEAGFRHPGHTEFLAELAGATQDPVMMLACPGLRVVPVTVHLSLKEALAALSRDLIVHAGRVTAAALSRDFGIDRPCLAVAGVNPHAGEDGTLGREEADIIAPAIRSLRDEGIQVDGPAPADTLFHAEARQRYDAALCMYHDQALIPLKTVDFMHGVNITLGLPFVRTSPDHGTALGIAGTGRASPASLIAALATAREMVAARARRAAAQGLA